MTERPPSPRPTTSTALTASARTTDVGLDDRVVVTTSQLAAAVTDVLAYRPDESTLEEALFELDRRGYVEWAAITRTGEHAWDLTDSPDRIADAVARIAVERVRAWLGVEDEELG